MKRDDVLADIETDKVVLEVVAPADGALAEIKAEEGSQVESEAILATFTEGAGGDSGGDSASAKSDSSDDDGADEKSVTKSSPQPHVKWLPSTTWTLPRLMAPAKVAAS
ncbi:hypothetical protein HORIV_18750 [Vreelandella olivaria]|uniref:Lipoyl-binding domain-containing protein n=1 Tax=Vreelandella olivaria TaxID=390919 RepID=A0ABM7GFQ4_9GAMM|nr:hypothetical protein HORIV_18750 [Halomonas olivaria]